MMRRLSYTVLLFTLTLLLCVGDAHFCLQTASCPGCLCAPVVVQTTIAGIETTLVDFGYTIVAANPQPLSHFHSSFISLRAPPSL